MALHRYSRFTPLVRILGLDAAQKILGSGEQHCERCSDAFFALHGDGASMSLDYGFDDKKPEPGTLDVGSSFETPIFGKQAGEFSFRYPRAGVRHLYGNTFFDHSSAHGDAAPGRGKLYGVTD